MENSKLPPRLTEGACRHSQGISSKLEGGETGKARGFPRLPQCRSLHKCNSANHQLETLDRREDGVRAREGERGSGIG